MVKIAEKAAIDKKLTMHIARHSSITTTIQYQANFVHKEFDNALDNVTNF